MFVDPLEDWEFAYMLGALEPITVRGQEGFATEHVYPADLDLPPTRVIMWLEEPDVLIRVTGDGLDVEELLALAESLEPATEAEWDAFVAEQHDAAATVATAIDTACYPVDGLDDASAAADTGTHPTLALLLVICPEPPADDELVADTATLTSTVDAD